MGTARSLKLAMADSGTMADGASEIGCPVDAPRCAGLAEVAAAVVPAAGAAPLTRADCAGDTGSMTSRSASGERVWPGAHSSTTAYWFSSLYMVAAWR